MARATGAPDLRQSIGIPPGLPEQTRYRFRGTPSAAGPPPDDSLGWHVLMTEAGREATAAAGLVGRRLEAYCPTFRKSVRRNYRRRQVVNRPLFPGYLFVLLPLETGVLHQRARHIPGVAGFLMVGSERPAILPHKVIREIRIKEADLAGDRSILPFRRGDTVELDAAPWRGQFGVIEKLSTRGRIKVLMAILGRHTLIDVSVHQVKTD